MPKLRSGIAMRRCGIFNTSPDTARRLIALGREDARKALAEAGMVGETKRASLVDED